MTPPAGKMTSLHEDIARLIKGEVFTDPVTREAYSTAACIYRLVPRAVVRPCNADDVAAIVSIAAQRGLPVTARGAGTGVAGQSIGSGIVIDFSAHMDRVIELDSDRGEGEVEPGIVLGELNKELSPQGLMFPPDPSSGDYATIGGMIANNASGAHSLKYGDTRKWTRKLKVVLADGSMTWIEKKPVMPPSMESSPVLENRVYSGLPRLLEEYGREIERSRPGVKKNSSGYHVWDLVSERTLDPAPLLVGSEGTLAVVVKAVLALAPLPGGRAAALIGLDSIERVEGAMAALLPLGPAALEIMDRLFIRTVIEHRDDLKGALPADAEALLLLEFEGGSERDARDKLERAKAEVIASCGQGITWRRAESGADMERLWQVRKAASPILYRMPGKRLTRFVEDLVVPPEKIAQGIRSIQKILEEHDAQAPVLGHAGSGNLHLNPRLELEHPAEREKMKTMAEKIYTTVIDMGGSITGEHGDGMLRAGYVPRMFPEIAPLFGRIKKLFDPEGILNPGKIIAPRGQVPDEPLKFTSAPERASPYPSLLAEPTREMLLRCHGCGLCRTYCPVVLATGEELSMPRSKVSLLRAVALGDLDMEVAEVHLGVEQALSLCTWCKRCITQCPTGIEPARIIRTFMHEHYRATTRPLRERLFARSERILAAGHKAPGLAAAVMKSGPARTVMHSALGIRKSSPILAPAGNKGRPAILHKEAPCTEPGRYGSRCHLVVFYRGCVGRYADSEGESNAACSVLRDLGLQVIEPGLPCCGEPRLQAADLEGARRMAQRLARELKSYVDQGIPVVTACPACALVLKHEYPGLLGEEAGQVPWMSFEFFEFLNLKTPVDRESFSPVSIGHSVYHRSCHHRALSNVDHAGEVLGRIPGLDLEKVEDACCGLAGFFGMRAENARVSEALSRALVRAAEDAGTGRVVSACPLCRMQIEALGLEPVSAVGLIQQSLSAK